MILFQTLLPWPKVSARNDKMLDWILYLIHAIGIGNGFPIGAVVTTPEIANSLNKALHFNTFGGNPMASAVGIAVLEIIEEEQLQANSKLVGTHILKGFEVLREKYEIVGDVRGQVSCGNCNEMKFRY